MQKQLWQVLSRLDIEAITARFNISFAFEVYIGRMNQETNKKAIQELRNVIKGLHADLRGKCRGKSHFNHGAVLDFTEGFTRFSLDLTKKYVYLVMSTCIKLAKKLTVCLQLAITTKYAYLALRVKAYFCCKNRPY